MNSAEITSLKEQLRHYQATTNSLETELRNETEAKEEALTRLSDPFLCYFTMISKKQHSLKYNKYANTYKWS